MLEAESQKAIAQAEQIIAKAREAAAADHARMLAELKAGIPSHATVDLTAPPEASEAEIRERMSGNICRCGAYSNIFEAIQQTAGRPA